jgi:hypothetical protein
MEVTMRGEEDESIPQMWYKIFRKDVGVVEG